ncbi:LysR substrate-binding domain-containing protein [Comamonas humi]
MDAPMTLSEIQDFLAVADSGSIRAAARARSITAPAMTQSMSRLEAKLHVPLLVRTTKGVQLSDYGKAFLVRARAIAREVQKSVDELAHMRGDSRGMLYIGTSATPTTTLIPHAVADFRRLMPQVSLNIVGGLYRDHMPLIRSGEMEFAVGPLPAAGIGADFAVEVLFENNLVLAVRRGSPLAQARSLRELQHAEWILSGPASQGPGAAILDLFARHPDLAPPRIVVQSSSLSVVQTLMMESDMVCALPQEFITSPWLQPFLVQIPVQEALPAYPISMFHRTDYPLSPAAELLATLIKRHAHYFTQGRTVRPTI